eukprot:GGOE01053670.1.p1 GENE.GGOE01053670.1~~GGOE01053670.1.p1  ORF type:complete len:715 (+),score=184.95 GGOE01053670.1:375-2519(+)
MQGYRDSLLVDGPCNLVQHFIQCLPPIFFRKREMSQKKKGTNDNVRVMVRVRPFNQKEITEAGGTPECTLEVNTDTIITAISPASDGQRREDSFPFDRVFWSMPPEQVQAPVAFAEQEDVYVIVGQPQLDSMFAGYNGCIFAYGQTSSGKTHSMMGYPGTGRGITPRICEELFLRIESAMESGKNTTFEVKLSFLEIYNEKVQDLMSKKREDLKIVHDPQKGPLVKGLTEKTVTTWEEVDRALTIGMEHRTTAATAMNDRSSRSHAVVVLALEMVDTLGKVGTKSIVRPRRSRANLVDLAGSEKVFKSKVEGTNLKEAIGINQSLTCLGRVIDGLVEQHSHIPYRDSVLTSLLADSLGGNSRTTMLAALSPAAVNYEETLSTLRYASRARKIVNVVRVNEDPTTTLIRELQEQLARMRESVLNGDVDSLQALIGTDQPITAGVMAQKTQELEAVINQIQALEEKEKAEEEIREQKWHAEREQIEARHNAELMEIQQLRDNLRQQKEELAARAQVLQADVKSKQRGLILNRMQGLTRLAAAKLKAEEHDEQKKNLQREMIINRLRSNSEKKRYKEMIESAKEVKTQALHWEKRSLELEADLKGAQQKVRQLEEQKKGGVGRGMGYLGLGGRGKGGKGQPPPIPKCDDCKARDADVQCPQCNGALLCLSCNDRRHRLMEEQRLQVQQIRGAALSPSRIAYQQPAAYTMRITQGGLY